MNKESHGVEDPNAGCKKLDNPIDWPPVLAILAIVFAVLAAVVGL